MSSNYVASKDLSLQVQLFHMHYLFEDELQLSINELEAKEAELNESSSQTLYVPRIDDGISSVEESKWKIFDTGELSHP
jgi:hypothetical protein